MGANRGKLGPPGQGGAGAMAAPVNGVPNWSAAKRWYSFQRDTLITPSLDNTTPAVSTFSLIPWIAPSSCTIDRVGVYSNGTGGAHTLRIGLYASNPASYEPTVLVGVQSAALDITTAGARLSAVGRAMVITAGSVYWWALQRNNGGATSPQLASIHADNHKYVCFGSPASLIPSLRPSMIRIARADAAIPDPCPALVPADAASYTFIPEVYAELL